MKKSVLSILMLLCAVTMTSCNSRQKQPAEELVNGVDSTEVKAMSDENK